MTNYVLTIEIQDGAVQEILDELNEAQETIYRCYSRLMDLGVVTIRTILATVRIFRRTISQIGLPTKLITPSTNSPVDKRNDEM